MRGKILHLTRAQVVERGHRMANLIPKAPPGAPADAGGRPVSYRLEPGYNGGSDPEAEHCASWSYGDRTPTADCVGFVLWASGIDRMQPGYKGSRDEWLNCDSLLDDADGAKKFCEPVAMTLAKPGDWLVSPSPIGHIGLIVRPVCRWTAGAETHALPVRVIDCSPRHGWENSIAYGEPWSVSCRALRPKFYAEP